MGEVKHSTSQGKLEHINLTVANPKETAAMLCRLFGWTVRWEGTAMDNGYTVHVGTQNDYIAVYSKGTPQKSEQVSYQLQGALNHIGIVVEDLDDTEQRVIAEGYTTNNHGVYEPGKRFYFVDSNDVEYEIVSYSPGR